MTAILVADDGFGHVGHAEHCRRPAAKSGATRANEAARDQAFHDAPWAVPGTVGVRN